MRQVEMLQDNGARFVGWIDTDHAIEGRRIDLNLGDGDRSPVVTIVRAWELERDLEDIQAQQENRRGFGGSIR